MTNVHLTQYGNPYKKTSTGKKVGLLGGALAGGVAFNHAMKSLLKNRTFCCDIADRFVSKACPNLNPETALDTFNRIMKRLPKFSSVVGAVMVGGVGLAIGAIVDKIKNHNKQTVADLTGNNNDNKA
ncbi:MAG: hypothetical protein NC191_04600 [Muribaculaceae bacterium]|nr:hypothetical protein [Muribaculaceae bacterium]